MALREYIELFAESSDFRADRINYTDCPECGRQGKFMVIQTEDGGLFGKCLRDSCAVQGGSRTSAGKLRADKIVRRVRNTVPRLVTSPMTAGMAAQLEARVVGFKAFKTLGAVQRAMAVGPDDSIVYHMRDRIGQHIGDVQRWYDGRKDKAKTHAYAETGGMAHWQRGEDAWKTLQARRSLVVVEDIPSAISFALAVPTGVALALCGTGMTRETAHDVRREQVDQVLICLDRDATDTARKLRYQWSAVFRAPTRIVPLDMDIKDCDPELTRQWWEQIR